MAINAMKKNILGKGYDREYVCIYVNMCECVLVEKYCYFKSGG